MLGPESLAWPWGLRAVPFSVAEALADVRPAERSSPSWRVYWGCLWLLNGVQASSTFFFTSFAQSHPMTSECVPVCPAVCRGL